MKRYYFFLLVVLILVVLAASLESKPLVAFAQAEPLNQPGCDQILEQLAQERDWRSELRDPRITSAADLHQWVETYRPVHDCLSYAAIPVTGEQADLHELSGLFLTLAGSFLSPDAGNGTGQGHLLTFLEIQDPAVIALREEVGLPVPDGFVYVWLYPSRESMPALLQQFFANEDVRGVTILTRYIIVIDRPAAMDDSSQEQLREWLRSQRSRTLSHEFVHAYIKAALGPERGFSLPRWYDEGLAIYFSGSSQPSSITYHDESGRVITWTAAPEDYARYRDTFNYLEQVYGREGLIERIRRSLAENDTALLYRELGVINENELYTRAEAERVRRSLRRVAIFAGIPLGAVLLLAIYKIWVPLAVVVFPGLHLRPWRWGAGKSAEDVIWLKTRGNVRGLARMLQYEDARRPQEAVYVRYTAAVLLAEVGDPAVVEDLIAALDDENSVVRAAAAHSLGELVNVENRARIVAALFPCFEQDSANEVRWAAAETIYRAGGETVIRPLEAAIRRWLRRPDSRSNQHWFIQWAAENGLYGAMIDLYPWLEPVERNSVSSHLSRELSPPLLARLEEACSSGDPALRELAGNVLGGC